MKKIFSIIAAMAIAIMASAQNYEYVGAFGMPYVNVNGGAVSALNAESFSDFVHDARPTAALEVGTYVTPVWGFSVEGTALFGTPGAHTFVDQHSVLANGKLNLSNLFGGYKGYPRRVEVVAVPGIGWGHDYGDLDEIKDRNYFNYRAAAEVNVNLGKARAWQINVRPAVLWINRGEAVSDHNVINPKFENAFANLTVGVTYKFGNRRVNSHNFVTNNYAYSKADYDAAMARIAELEGRKPVVKEVVVEKEVVKEVVKEVPVVEGGSTVVSFPIGSATLSALEKAKLDNFAKSFDKNSPIQVIGSADTKTGSKSRNNYLASERAKVVKEYLVKTFGVTNVKTSTELDINALPEASRAAYVVVECADVD